MSVFCEEYLQMVQTHWMMRAIDRQRIVRMQAVAFFKGGIETQEQLDTALSGLREECEL